MLGQLPSVQFSIKKSPPKQQQTNVCVHACEHFFSSSWFAQNKRQETTFTFSFTRKHAIKSTAQHNFCITSVEHVARCVLKNTNVTFVHDLCRIRRRFTEMKYKQQQHLHQNMSHIMGRWKNKFTLSTNTHTYHMNNTTLKAKKCFIIQNVLLRSPFCNQ